MNSASELAQAAYDTKQSTDTSETLPVPCCASCDSKQECRSCIAF